ncbi:hypothetical protein AX774_g2609 [Zancudomyces culisetae]|uniref:Uncharacterized protein n=1 Tax=Zancudomyces culisetae TaxID=1213189 RepID=A0A1R1PSM0_ZANCU|nr:hypothetical protein AX774_g2609 [Zancudomyces culisetae]|eukprot:OMH83882.1 hypothetical protein AX774_g2609 [Zancudomyces culisetae]
MLNMSDSKKTEGVISQTEAKLRCQESSVLYLTDQTFSPENQLSDQPDQMPTHPNSVVDQPDQEPNQSDPVATQPIQVPNRHCQMSYPLDTLRSLPARMLPEPDSWDLEHSDSCTEDECNLMEYSPIIVIDDESEMCPDDVIYL